MELEQLTKRLEWLDEERRKDKAVIATLENRIGVLENIGSTQKTELRELTSDINRLNSSVARVSQVEEAFAAFKVEMGKNIDTFEKLRQDHSREVEKARQADLENFNKTLGDFRKLLDTVTDLKKAMQSRVEEEFRLARLIEEANQKINDSQRADEEYHRAQRLLDEGRKQDSKRLTDTQGELTALRKRMDEQRGKMDIAVDSVRKLELRLGEIQAAEGERRQSMAAFLEKQTLQQVDRDRLWKEWNDRFQQIEKQGQMLEAQLQSLDVIQRSVKRSQEVLDDASQRFERRINEITEMQRLSEDRFRQEWISFKTEDQKRWSNYTLTHEEAHRENARSFEKAGNRLVALEDSTQEMSDLLHQMNENTKKRLNTLLEIIHDWSETQSELSD
jgi:chromosome segregation ATPase